MDLGLGVWICESLEYVNDMTELPDLDHSV